MSGTTKRILGLDPGLRATGWGIITAQGNHIRFVACGVVRPPIKGSLAERLLQLSNMLNELITLHQPTEAVVEQTFVNKNPSSALLLGMARGVVLLAPAAAGYKVAEYSANHIKKCVTGVGHADKKQVQAMVQRLLPGMPPAGLDASDALAAAICHANQKNWQEWVA